MSVSRVYFNTYSNNKLNNGAPKVELDDQGDFLVSFDFGPSFRKMKERVKTIDGRVFVPQLKKWRVPGLPRPATGLQGFVEAFSPEIDTRAAERLTELLGNYNGNTLREASRATESDLVVPGFEVPLRPFQRAGVEYVLQAKRTFIGDDPGAGKSHQAMAAIHAINAYPAVIVCQSNMKFAWRDYYLGGLFLQGALPDKRISILNSRTASPLPPTDIAIINYDILDAWIPELLQLEPRALINDESANLKNPRARRTKAAMLLAKAIPSDGLIINLTGTPILNKPKDLAAQLQVIGRWEEFGAFKFYIDYCGAYKDRRFNEKGVWNLDGATNLDELSTKLRETCFIRRMKADVLDELPPKQRAVIPLDLSNRKQYIAAEHDVIAYLRMNAEQQAAFQAKLEGLTPLERKRLMRERAQDAAYRAQKSEQLVKIGVLKKLAAEGKLKAALEWISSMIESEKLVLFVHHRHIAQQILENLDLAKVAQINGSQTAKEKQVNVNLFQSDPDCKLIVCSLMAASTGITLTAASNVAFLELGWGPAEHDQAEDRCWRQGAKNAVTAWYLLAQRTIDEDVAELIESKRKVISTVTDGTPNQEDGIMSDLVQKLLKRD